MTNQSLPDPWEHTREEEVQLAGRIGGPEAADEAWRRWPREFEKAVKDRKSIPLAVLVDRGTKSVIALAVEDSTFNKDDLQYLWELAKALQSQHLVKNPAMAPLYLWATASFLSFLSSLLSIFRLKAVPLVAAAENPRKGRFRLRDEALEGTLLAASFLMVRREGKPQLAQAIEKRAMALFPKTWKAVFTQFGDPDDPETGDLAVAGAEAVIEAASIDDLKTILPKPRKKKR